MNGEVRPKSGNIDVAAYETAPLSRCNDKEPGKMLELCVPAEKKAIYKQTLISDGKTDEELEMMFGNANMSIIGDITKLLGMEDSIKEVETND